MGELTDLMNKNKHIPTHMKKNKLNIQDDIQLTAKLQLIKRLDGNNNALVIGKFRVLTDDGHVKIIKRALENFDNVVVCIVTSKLNKHTIELRQKLIETVFPNIEIIHASTGNLSTILQKSPININAIIAGSDRVDGYKKQLVDKIGIKAVEINRYE